MCLLNDVPLLLIYFVYYVYYLYYYYYYWRVQPPFVSAFTFARVGSARRLRKQRWTFRQCDGARTRYYDNVYRVSKGIKNLYFVFFWNRTFWFSLNVVSMLTIAIKLNFDYFDFITANPKYYYFKHRKISKN